MEVTFKGTRTLAGEPIFIKAADVPKDINSAVDNSGNKYPAQKYKDGVIIIADVERNIQKTFILSEENYGNGIEIKKKKDAVDVYIGDKFFTSYVYSADFVKPYLGPIMTSFGESFTRLDFQATEHPHHRSIFLGVGDVNKIDFWNEPENRGGQEHYRFKRVASGSAYAEITAQNVWKNVKGTPLIDEERTFIIYNQSENCRYIDLTIKFTASYRNIKFGPTKEAGPLGIRVSEALRADKGTGRMVNSYGAENEGECWGRSANWCDYSGEIKGHKCGISVFDNESNERYPTSWHIRNYGLFAANNLFFKGGFDIPKGKSVTYKYRICFHEGDFCADDRFIQYVN